MIRQLLRVRIRTDGSTLHLLKILPVLISTSHSPWFVAMSESRSRSSLNRNSSSIVSAEQPDIFWHGVSVY